MIIGYTSAFVNDGKGGTIQMPPFITQETLDTLTNTFTTRANDVFIATYPKCGTTWTEQIVHLILNDGEQGDLRLTDASPWLETVPNRPGGMAEYLQSEQERRLISSHLPLPLMPDVTAVKGQYIYVARNPKDTAVSAYYHIRSKAGYDGSWAEFIDLFMAGDVRYGSYFDHILPWWKVSQSQANILFLTYEEMKRDLKTVIKQIADFITVPLNDALVEKVMTKSSFKVMATNEKTNLDWVPQREGLPTHYRKGIVGDWRNHFTPEQNAHFDQLYAERMRGSQLMFDFG